MMAYSAGQILSGDDGRMHIRIREERYYVHPEDLGRLFFGGENAPLMKKGPGHGVHEIVGAVSFNPSGRAIVIALARQRYMIPRDRFVAVAFGEEIACTFFETPSEGLEIDIFTLKTRDSS